MGFCSTLQIDGAAIYNYKAPFALLATQFQRLSLPEQGVGGHLSWETAL